MNKLRIVVLVAAAVSLLYSFLKSIVLRMPGRSRAAARTKLGEADWLDGDSKAGAFVKITGKVQTREAGERMVSPLSEIRCVALHLRAYVRRGKSPRGQMIEKVQMKPFVIEDDGNKILVEATHALLDVAATPPPKTADIHKLFAELQLADANAATTKCDETLVAVGSTVTVAGKLVMSPTLKLVGDEANPIVIRNERVLAESNEP